MADTFRALCAELLNGLVEQQHPDYPWPGYTLAAMDRARALLAEPPAEGPSADEWDALVKRAWDEYETVGYLGERFMYDSDFCNALDFVRRELARWGRPAAAPVPVGERLPGPGEWVWHCYAGVRLWEHGRYNGRQFFIGDGPESQPATHWLPANALPTPEATNG